MMTTENATLGRTTAGFALAAAVTVLFNTVLACAKDAYQPLLRAMNAIAWHNWITQGLADLILFFGLGLILSSAGLPQRIAPGRLISFLAVAAIVAGVGLFAWYALF
jgi:hypothetical protein